MSYSEQSQIMLRMLVKAGNEGRWVRTAELIEASAGQSHTRRLRDLREAGCLIESRRVRVGEPNYVPGAWEYRYVGSIPPDVATAQTRAALISRLRQQLLKLSGNELECVLDGVI